MAEGAKLFIYCQLKARCRTTSRSTEANKIKCPSALKRDSVKTNVASSPQPYHAEGELKRLNNIISLGKTELALICCFAAFGGLRLSLSEKAKLASAYQTLMIGFFVASRIHKAS